MREFLAKGRSRHIYTELIAVKDGKSGEPRGRSADVLFYRYDDDAGLRALVDLERGSVADVVPVDGRISSRGGRSAERCFSEPAR